MLMKNLLILLIAMMFVGCAGAPENSENSETSTEIDLENELAAIEELRQGIALLIKEGRYEDIGKYTTEDIITHRPGGDGWDNMYALGQERGRFPYDSIIMKPHETIIVSDSVAYDVGESWVYYTNEEGEQVELRNRFLAILKKQNGEWRLHREVGSSHME